MLKAALVGAVALTTGMTSLACAQSWQNDYVAPARIESQTGGIVTEAHIARLRTILNLTPEQRQLWAPVEAALHELARQQAREEHAAGLVSRMGERATTIALTTVRLRRLASVASPLIHALDDNQKRNAMTFVRHVGLENLVAAF